MNGTRRRWAITLQAGERPAFQRPPYVDAVFARDDPKPALVQLARLTSETTLASSASGRAGFARGRLK